MALMDASLQGVKRIDWTKCENGDFWALNFKRPGESSVSVFFHFKPYRGALVAQEMMDQLEKLLAELRERLAPPKKYYKVVRRCKGHLLRSCVVHDTPLAVTYKVGEFVSAHSGEYGLLVFNTKVNARTQLVSHLDQLWEVEVRDVCGILPVSDPKYATCWPNGTVMVGSVKLVRLVC